MNDDDHIRGLGQIVGNLLSLEMILRIFLAYLRNQTLEVPTAADQLVNETVFTNYHSLGPLIDIYNSGLSIGEQQFLVDKDVVKIRDAIAHGRLLTNDPNYPLTLYKFGKPSNGRVRVERIDAISERWLNEKKNFVFAQMTKIHNCGKSRNYDCFP
jgi:hypothetical protein